MNQHEAREKLGEMLGKNDKGELALNKATLGMVCGKPRITSAVITVTSAEELLDLQEAMLALGMKPDQQDVYVGDYVSVRGDYGMKGHRTSNDIPRFGVVIPGDANPLSFGSLIAGAATAVEAGNAPKDTIPVYNRGGDKTQSIPLPLEVEVSGYVVEMALLPKEMKPERVSAAQIQR